MPARIFKKDHTAEVCDIFLNPYAAQCSVSTAPSCSRAICCHELCRKEREAQRKATCAARGGLRLSAADSGVLPTGAVCAAGPCVSGVGVRGD